MNFPSLCDVTHNGNVTMKGTVDCQFEFDIIYCIFNFEFVRSPIIVVERSLRFTLDRFHFILSPFPFISG